MAVLDSTSSEAAIIAAYMDNCGYYEDSDAAMARRLVTACEAMLSRAIRVIDAGGQRMEFTTDSLHTSIERAKAFVAARDPASARRAVFTRGRPL